MKSFKKIAVVIITSTTFLSLSTTAFSQPPKTMPSASISSASPKPGKFCAKKFHNKKSGVLKCSKDAKGNHWRWR
jgi:hypothetical protein